MKSIIGILVLVFIADIIGIASLLTIGFIAYVYISLKEEEKHDKY